MAVRAKEPSLAAMLLCYVLKVERKGRNSQNWYLSRSKQLYVYCGCLPGI
jgi:hypothetical protein